MDELTLDNKKYLSSKRAAQVTGYAKDYVGQLCREGRVTARLVGRNWYVLESSILEHRFGAEETEEVPQTQKNDVDSVWETPKYTSEPIDTVPQLIEKTTERASEPNIEALVSNKKVLSDMQSAWQEWFDQEKMLPDASGMLLSDHVEEESESTEEVEPDTSLNHPVISSYMAPQEPLETGALPIHIDRIHVPVAPRKFIPVDHTPIRSASVAHLRQSTEQNRVQGRKPPQKRSGDSAFALRAFFLSIAGLAVVVTFIGSGGFDTAAQDGGIAKYVTDFLSGTKNMQLNK